METQLEVPEGETMKFTPGERAYLFLPPPSRTILLPRRVA